MLRMIGSAETEMAEVDAPTRGPILALDGVTAHHTVGRRRVTVLEDISLRVWPRDTVAIWGPRRSGKTTLLRIAAGVEASGSGAITLVGHNLRSTSARKRTERLREIAYVAKEWRVARGRPVLNHVALPLLAAGSSLRAATRRAWEVLERVDARECARLPAHDLSPSQAGRVSLAQALARSPRLLLVDEPGAGMSPDERDDLLRLLHSLARETPDLALVIASQDASGMQGVTRTMSLSNGRLRSFDRLAEVVPFLGRTTSEP